MADNTGLARVFESGEFVHSSFVRLVGSISRDTDDGKLNRRSAPAAASSPREEENQRDKKKQAMNQNAESDENRAQTEQLM